jgi:2-polyprenyl-3-methyl-5-hydroxy-6-metoxy-1,4-benzoquinol methylase
VNRRDHWEQLWRTHPPTAVSWYAPHLAESLRLIQEVTGPDASIIDVGGGASTLVDDLVAAGYSRLTVLDVSDTALDTSRARLGAQAATVEWIHVDITTARLPAAAYDVWHDRAVFHFLTEQSDRDAYLEVLDHGLKPHGYVVIGTFAPAGPSRCSGLDVVRYDASGLQRVLGPDFLLSAAAEQTHVTPDGLPQRFNICRLRRTR